MATIAQNYHVNTKTGKFYSNKPLVTYIGYDFTVELVPRNKCIQASTINEFYINLICGRYHKQPLPQQTQNLPPQIQSLLSSLPEEAQTVVDTISTPKPETPTVEPLPEDSTETQNRIDQFYDKDEDNFDMENDFDVYSINNPSESGAVDDIDSQP